MHLQAAPVQRPEQGLLLAPRMLQAIEVLQLSCADIGRLVEEEMTRNELLEAAPPRRLASDGAAAARRRDGDEGHRGWLESLPAAADALVEHVRDQLAWLDLDARLRRDVLRVVECLDDRGLLTLDESELAAACGSEDADTALEVLRSLEPRGLGARDAIHAVLLQLAPDDPDQDLLEVLLRVHLEPLARGRLDEVARDLHRDPDDVRRLLDRVRDLRPWPGAAFRGDPARPVWPDLVLHADADSTRVSVDPTGLPQLGLSEEYVALGEDRDTPAVLRRYLRQKASAARALIEAVQARGATLERVGEVVVEHQRDFFVVGEAGLRPLRMTDVAARLGLHTSTVSRAVAGKHLQTPRGVFPLRFFFDGPAGSAGGGVTVGRRGVRRRIQELVAVEPPASPLSDEDLVRRLAADGHRVARRTVAKYRTELGIPASWTRKKDSHSP